MKTNEVIKEILTVNNLSQEKLAAVLGVSQKAISNWIERELVSKIQNMRKETGFEVTDRIEVYYKADGKAIAPSFLPYFGPSVLSWGFNL